jgi:MFS family permease
MDKTNKNNSKGNISKLYLMSFADGMWFTGPIYILFLLDRGISFAEIGLIMGGNYLMSFIFDLPSSIWADRYSRKFILILGGLALMLCNVLIYTSDSFVIFFAAFCLAGIGNALIAGTYNAFFYDTLLSTGKEKEYEKIQSGLLKYYFVSRIISSIAGAYLYQMNPKSPFLLTAFADFVYIIVAIYLQEPMREKSTCKSFAQIKEGLAFLLKHKLVRDTIIIFSIAGAMWDVLFNYSQPAMEISHIPVIYFGLIFAVGNLFGFLGASFYSKIKSKVDWKGIMVLYLLIDLAVSFFFGTQIAALAILSVALLTFSSGSFDIFIGSIVHENVPSSHRATTLSIRNQMYMLFSLVLINIVSFVMDRSSFLIGMLTCAAIVLIALLAFLRTCVYKVNVISTE